MQKTFVNNTFIEDFNFALLKKAKIGKKLFPLALMIIALLLFIKLVNNNSSIEKSLTEQYINAPKVDDIYFLDFRKITSDLRPKEKYRLAKVVDITGEIVTLNYGNFYYQRQHAAEQSIRYGQLRYKGYFETGRRDFHISDLIALRESKAIYMIKRPVLNKLFGNFVSPDKVATSTAIYLPGKHQNISGEAFLNDIALETNLRSAFEQFKLSADYGYAQGQVNLASMYLNGQHVEKDIEKSLYWFKQAALQGHKPGVLKYIIVCQQVKHCSIMNFYDELVSAGVNIKVRSFDFSLEPSI